MKLFFAPRTRATRPRWMLEELEVPYELVRLDLSKGEHRAPGYLAINPLGELPAFLDGELRLLEPSAICLYLADRFPEKQLAPAVGTAERGAYYQWMAFAESVLDPVMMEFHRNALLPPEQKVAREEAMVPHRARLAELLKVVEAGLQGGEVLVGSRFSAADVMMASILHIGNNLGLLQGHPAVGEYVLRHTQRPAVRRAVS